MKKLRVAQIGTFDLDNLGDLIFPLVFRHWILNLSQAFDVEITLFSPKGCAAGQFYIDQIQAFPIADFEEMHRENNFDHVFIGGGDLLRSDDWSLLDVYKENSGAAFSNLFSPTCQSNLPLHIMAIGAPFPLEPDFSIFLQNSLSRSGIVSARDSATRNIFNGIGIDAEILPDIVLSIAEVWPFECLSPVEQLMPEVGAHPYFVFQGSQYVIKDHEYEMMVDYIYDLERRLNMIPVFLEIGSAIGDSSAATELIARLAKKNSRAIRVKKQSIKDMVAVLANAQAYIGSSMHGSIISFAYKRPVVSYVGRYSNKVANLFKEITPSILYNDLASMCVAGEYAYKFIRSHISIERHSITESKYGDSLKAFISKCLKKEVLVENSIRFDPRINRLYLIQQNKFVNFFYEAGHRVKAIEKNANDQILYRDSLIDELRQQLDDVNANANSQILYRDALANELRQKLDEINTNANEQIVYRDQKITDLETKLIVCTESMNQSGLKMLFTKDMVRKFFRLLKVKK